MNSQQTNSRIEARPEAPPYRPLIVAGGWTATALLIGYSATGVAFDILLVIMKGISLLTGDPGVLSLDIDWVLSGTRVASLIAGTVVAVATMRYRRRATGACSRCGRTGHHPHPESDHTGAAGQDEQHERSAWSGLSGYTRHAGYASALLAAAYGGLKAQWGLGGTFGLDDPHAFGDDVHLWTPGLGDTAVLGLIGVALGIGFARTWTPRFIPRWMPLTAAFVGSVMLISTGLISTGMMVAAELGLLEPQISGDLGGVSAWVFQGIYPLFLTWGLTMAAAAIGYHYRTRGRCAACGLG
ncbi:hypothetical protein [Microtetraspora sp. NBRC 16547]|uniref:hypothetical protein n=1 Tax=Microtetraspora sp. NBRC 16547 TaxID=3030993 RepID=UPI0024A2400C|nr:hypothetical protein [Microtetraspora sp. NBRC 16547]GLW98648.1 hypothetical protein Misp02_27350 [Microtetraspora sp. NBRC 16547]